MLHGQRGSSPRLELQAQRIEMGAVADAMQWKKSAVFALADPAGQDLLDWLRQAPAGLETMNVFKSDGSQTAPRSLFVLYGWSTSGADELRRAAVDSAIVEGHSINVYVSRPQVQLDGMVGGTADMRFVGWEIPLLESLASGSYKAVLHVRRDTIRVFMKPSIREEKVVGEGYQKAAEVDFAR